MLYSQATSIAFPEERIALAKVLYASFKDLNRRAYQVIPAQFRTSLYAKTTIEAILTLSCSAISGKGGAELQEWLIKNASLGFDIDIARPVIAFLKKEILRICGQVFPGPSSLIGLIRLQFSDLLYLLDERSTGAEKNSALSQHDPLDSLIDKILREIDGKDYATGEHSRQVSKWCYRIGMKLGLPKNEVDFVARGGKVHDIGKLTVPDGILKAPRRLTDEERPIMESHVVAGFEMVHSSYPKLHEFVMMIRGHHERLDGRGYPDKLIGNDIPIFTRIVTVADCYNAMVGRRPYRPPMCPELAVKQIYEHRGTQFDPDVADAMIELSNEDNRACRNKD